MHTSICCLVAYMLVMALKLAFGCFFILFYLFIYFGTCSNIEKMEKGREKLASVKADRGSYQPAHELLQLPCGCWCWGCSARGWDSWFLLFGRQRGAVWLHGLQRTSLSSGCLWAQHSSGLTPVFSSPHFQIHHTEILTTELNLFKLSKRVIFNSDQKFLIAV